MCRQGPQPLFDRVAARFSADDRVRRDVVVGRARAWCGGAGSSNRFVMADSGIPSPLIGAVNEPRPLRRSRIPGPAAAGRDAMDEAASDRRNAPRP
jgi:hypothetical protein